MAYRAEAVIQNWSAIRYYRPNTAVCDGGKCWRAKVGNINVPPTEGATWTEMGTGGGAGGGPHAATHATGQADAVSPASIGAADLSEFDALSDLVSDHIAVAATDSELASGLAGKADTGHTHDAGDVNAGTLAIARIPTGQTGTTVPLGNDARFSDARTPLAHTHNASDVNAGVLAIARIPTGQTGTTVPFGNDARFTDARTPLAHDILTAHTGFPGGTANFLRADGTFAPPPAGGGSDPWTYLKVTGADFTTSSATAVDITGLGFAPAADTEYEFHGMLYLRTATTTVNPRAGLAWATGLTDGIARIEEAQAAGTAPLNANGNIGAALLIAVGGLPNTTQSWPATLWGTFRSGASPSGSVRVQLASETAGTVVRATIGSFLRYRIIP